MMSCTYCGQRATVQIPSTPSDVCLTHAIEFWTGLLAYRKDRSDAFQTPEPPCTRPLFNQLSARATGMMTTATSSSDRENSQLRRAS
jgi:hypothetical protein